MTTRLELWSTRECHLPCMTAWEMSKSLDITLEASKSILNLACVPRVQTRSGCIIRWTVSPTDTEPRSTLSSMALASRVRNATPISKVLDDWFTCDFYCDHIEAVIKGHVECRMIVMTYIARRLLDNFNWADGCDTRIDVLGSTSETIRDGIQRISLKWYEISSRRSWSKVGHGWLDQHMGAMSIIEDEIIYHVPVRPAACVGVATGCWSIGTSGTFLCLNPSDYLSGWISNGTRRYCNMTISSILHNPNVKTLIAIFITYFCFWMLARIRVL